MVAALIVLAILLSLALVALAALARAASRSRRLDRRCAIPARAGSRSQLRRGVCRRAHSRPRCGSQSAERATLVPAFIAIIPAHLSLDGALTREPRIATLQAAVEQRAADFGVPVDPRIETGRTNRHALRRTVARECFDKIVIAANANGSPGFDPTTSRGCLTTPSVRSSCCD